MNKNKHLYAAQKMASIGTLANGIAHEFNNLLYIISGCCELLLNETDLKDNELIHEIFKSTKRGSKLVKQFFSYSQEKHNALATTYINVELVRIKKLIERLIPKMVEIQLELVDDLYTVHADVNQIEQIFINLAINARDAMPEGGKLIFKTENCTYQDTPYILIMVSDTGTGMDKKTLSSIFDPFFTTKAAGQGTGLGLPVVRDIIKAHNGEIYCKSIVNKGSCFSIYLPAKECIEDSLRQHSLTSVTQKGHETILIVDDEETVCVLTTKMLMSLGYTTIEVNCGENALSTFTNKRNVIDVILLDLNMPGIGGKKCLEHLINLDPFVKVVIISGYASEEIIKETLDLGAKGYIAKPFLTNDLSRIIRYVLEKG